MRYFLYWFCKIGALFCLFMIGGCVSVCLVHIYPSFDFQEQHDNSWYWLTIGQMACALAMVVMTIFAPAPPRPEKKEPVDEFLTEEQTTEQ